MSVSVKRSFQVYVKVDDSFKKKYILLLNQLISGLDKQIKSFERSKASRQENEKYISFIDQKMNQTFLKMDQLRQKIEDVKQCPIGDSFLVTVLDGYSDVIEGDDLISVLGPGVIQAEGATIKQIK